MDKEDIKEDIIIPTIFLGAVALTSFTPVIQIILMTLVGGLTKVITMTFEKKETMGLFFNTVLTVFGLFLFYKTKDTLVRIMTSFLVLFFGQGVMLFTVEYFLNEGPYYIYWTVISGTPMLLTLLVGLVKYIILNRKMSTRT